MRLHQGDGWSLRLAGPCDDAALRGLVRRIPMGGSVDVAQEREPDFHALPRLHGGSVETYLVEDDAGRAVGCGTSILTEGLVAGRRTPRGHACDLRVDPSFRGGRVLPALGRVALERARDQHGVELFTTAVLDGNRRARGALERRGAGRTEQPVSRPLLRYRMADLPLAGVLPRPALPVEAAGADDLPELRRFWTDGQRRRLLGRPDAWTDGPDTPPEDHLAVRDRTGGLLACAAFWDVHAVKQQRILRYGPRLAAFRALHAPLARASGRAPLPAVGGHLRFAYLTRVETAPELDDAERASALRALVDAARRRLAPHHHFLAVMEDGPAMQRALRRRLAVRLPVTLHSLCLPDSPWLDMDLAEQGRDGVAFEMALA